jgi:farnesyl-diphosphate farnesyltransferase
MSKVSRSFALVVPWLEEPLQEQIASAYLLCRTLDNIEDCGQPLAWQQARFAEFKQMLAEPARAQVMLYQWERLSWPGLSPEEAELMTLEGGMPLWLIYASFPDSVRAMCQYWISRMADGMASILGTAQATSTRHGNIHLLATVDAYNEYFYHVAGTVGGLGTELMIAHYRLSGTVSEHLLDGSKACGRALQKTNIIKDFAEDLARNVCYLPAEWLREIDYQPLTLAGAPSAWCYAVIQDVLNELRRATDYVLSIPTEAMGYRIASLVCLLPAYQTMITAAQCQPQLFTRGHQVKITRDKMVRCLHEATSVAADNDAVADLSRQLEQAVHTAFSAEPVYS